MPVSRSIGDGKRVGRHSFAERKPFGGKGSPPQARVCTGVVAVVLVLNGCGGGDPTATDPQKVFADGFVSDPGRVVIEAEGGTIIGGYDAWLRMMPAEPVKPRFADGFEPIDCTAPVAWFAAKAGEEGLFDDEDGGRLFCRGYRDERLGIPNGRWLVKDYGTGRTWFRVWKGKGE